MEGLLQGNVEALEAECFRLGNEAMESAVRNEQPRPI